MEDLCWLTIAEVGRGLRRRDFTSEQVTETFLERIANVDDTLRSYITVTADRARQDARRADAELAHGVDRGPLHGVPIGLKDAIDTAGIRTTAGSRILMDRVPAWDATVVRRLTGAGMVLLGKHALTEFTTGAARNPTFGMTHNPWALDRVPGGSSSGTAAAVAGGLAIAGLGTDTTGSVRQPAALCGLVGVRPTHGEVPLGGVLGLSPTFDTVGPIARTVEDAALLLGAVGARAWAAKIERLVAENDLNAGLQGFRVAVPQGSPWEDVDPEVERVVTAALDQLRMLGATTVSVDFGEVDGALEARRMIQYAEAARIHAPWLTDRRADYDPSVLALLDFGRSVSDAVEREARAKLRRFRREAKQRLRGFDLLASPTTPATAWSEDDPRRFGGLPIRIAGLRLTAIITAAGLAAISLPCGTDAAGRPIGLQLACRPQEEPRMLTAAWRYEAAVGRSRQRPRLTPRPA